MALIDKARLSQGKPTKLGQTMHRAPKATRLGQLCRRASAYNLGTNLNALDQHWVDNSNGRRVATNTSHVLVVVAFSKIVSWLSYVAMTICLYMHLASNTKSSFLPPHFFVDGKWSNSKLSLWSL